MFHPQGPTFFELARQALSSTERGYDLLAPKFDYTPFRTPDAVLNAIPPLLGPPASIPAALDVCCGTGAAMEMLRPVVSQRLVGLDMSQGMLQVARERLDAMPGPAEVEWVRGDALRMPFDSEFDLVVCFSALGHILPSDQPRFVREVARVLRPGGRFVTVTSEMPPRLSARYWMARGFNAAMHVRNWLIRPPFHMYYLTFLVREARQMLEQAGLTVEVRDDIWTGRLRELAVIIATKGGMALR